VKRRFSQEADAPLAFNLKMTNRQVGCKEAEARRQEGPIRGVLMWPPVRRKADCGEDGEMATSNSCETEMSRILVVEPDPLYRKLFPIWIRDHFGRVDLQVLTASDAQDAEDGALAFQPDMLVTALELGAEMDGLTLAGRLQAALGGLRVVLISKVAPYATLRRRLAQFPGAQFLAKPVGESTFVQVLQTMLPGPTPSRSHTP
jgi:CheY-like chemotaxis protein